MFTLPPLLYPYDALEPYIDKETMHLHHDKHHAAYVDNLNKALEAFPDIANKPIEDLIKNLKDLPEELHTKVRNHGGGHFNHTHFWTMMTPSASAKPPTQSNFTSAISDAFGTLETFKERFAVSAMSHFGSGWAWLTLTDGKLEIQNTANQDSPLSEWKIPILGLDLWEHAYYLKYQNKRADYIAAWWNVVNWPQVEENFTKAIK